jgi:ABC-type uncharacterized transport system substrate-binding protein
MTHRLCPHGSRSIEATRQWLIAALLAVVMLGAGLRPASAHPHILIDAHAEVLFNAQGQIVGVTNVWDFDDAFSAFAIQGYDSKSDGNPTRADLQPLAEVNLQSLAEYGYFTQLKVDGIPVAVGHPRDYYDVFADEKLTLHFTLPLAKPLDIRGKTVEIDVYDPAYFAGITFAKGTPVRLAGNSTGCESYVHRPEPLDAVTASRLAVIPADQRTLPPELFAITNKLVNATRVSCK